MASSALTLCCGVKRKTFSLSNTRIAAWLLLFNATLKVLAISLRKKKSHVNWKENNLSLFADNMISYWKKTETPPKNKQEQEKTVRSNKGIQLQKA